MKKALSKLQLILAAICASSIIWLIIYESFKYFDTILKPFKVFYITFIVLVILSIILSYVSKKK